LIFYHHFQRDLTGYLKLISEKKKEWEKKKKKKGFRAAFGIEICLIYHENTLCIKSTVEGNEIEIV